jgi:hypothetical protein
MPWYEGRDHVCPIGAFTRHGGVEFCRSTSLPAPLPHFEGTDKDLRQVKLRTAEEVRSPPVAGLVRSIIRLGEISEKRTR